MMNRSFYFSGLLFFYKHQMACIYCFFFSLSFLFQFSQSSVYPFPLFFHLLCIFPAFIIHSLFHSFIFPKTKFQKSFYKFLRSENKTDYSMRLMWKDLVFCQWNDISQEILNVIYIVCLLVCRLEVSLLFFHPLFTSCGSLSLDYA